jgi:hypothetical protein
MSALMAAHLCDVHCCAEVTAATLALVKAFLAIRVRKAFVPPHALTGGDLAASGVDAEWVAFADSLSAAQIEALRRASDKLRIADLHDLLVLHLASSRGAWHRKAAPTALMGNQAGEWGVVECGRG